MDTQNIAPEIKYRQPGAMPDPNHHWLTMRKLLKYAFFFACFMAVLATAAVAYNHQVANSIPIYQSPEHVATSAATATWKTYTNSQDGFSFNYPSDWVASSTKPKYISAPGEALDKWVQNMAIGVSSPKTVNDNSGCNDLCGPDIAFLYFSNISNVPKDGNASTLDKYISNEFFDNADAISLGGKSGYGIETLEATSTYAMMVQNNGHIYVLLFYNAENQKGLTNTDKQILSTFKFTNAETLKTIDESNNGQTINLSLGQTLKLDLNSSYWQVDSSDSAILKESGQSFTSNSTVPGVGTGLQETNFQALNTGIATINAKRTSCGEAMLCNPTQYYVVTVVIK